MQNEHIQMYIQISLICMAYSDFEFPSCSFWILLPEHTNCLFKGFKKVDSVIAQSATVWVSEKKKAQMVGRLKRMKNRSLITCFN